MKFVVYARQSSGDEEESASVEQQIQVCKEYAENQGWNVVGEYFDKNTSGKTYPELPEAINLSKADSVYQEWLNVGGKRRSYRSGLAEVFNQLNKIDGIIIYDFTRLMRPLTDSFLESYIKQTILKSGVKLYSVKEGLIDFSTFSTSLVTSLESRINDNQIAISKAKSMAALKKLQDEGYRYTGANFLGFKTAGRQKVTVDETEMTIVKKVFSMVNAGYAYTTICKAVNSLPEAKRSYTYNDIVKICNRLEYAGKCLDSKGEIIDSKVFPEVISFAEVLKAKNRVNNKAIKNRDKTTVHPLSGLVYCGGCGRILSIASSKNIFTNGEKFYYYHCQHLSYEPEQPSICKGANIRENYDSADKNGLKEAILPLLLPCIEKECRELENTSIDKTSIQVKLEKIEKLESILDRKLVDGDITEAEYDHRFSEYKKEKQALKAELLNAGVDNSELVKDLQQLALFISVNGRINDVQYKQLAQKYIHKIVVFPEYIEVFMIDGLYVKIERIRMASARVLPAFTIHKEKSGLYTLNYFYKSWKDENAEINTIYEDTEIIITTQGRNPAPYEYLKKRGQKKRLKKAKRIY